VLAVAFLAANSALAQAAPAETKKAEDVARDVGQAARGVADAADELADSALSAQNAAADKKSPLERARDGVVVLERAGKPIGVGTVLNGDGRILTALSPLTHGNNVDARFADGSVSRVRIGHVDRGWDLALLLPQNGRWKKGLKPSKKSPTGAGLALRSFSQIGDKGVAVSRTIVRGTNTLMGGDSELLRDALELASKFKESEIGAPILDEHGDVVAVVARACQPTSGEDCKQVPFGVPVTAVRAFLRTVPTDAVPPAPWLGVQGVAESAGPVRGVRLLGVHPESPAAAAGLRGSADKNTADVIVAVDSAPVTSPEALAEAINRRAVGDNVQLLLFGGGKFRQVSLSLRAVPEESAPRQQQKRLHDAKPAQKPRARPKPAR
jgi:serine protease Do